MADKTLKTSEKREYTDDTGKFKENNPGRPKGSKNKFSMAKLEEAIELEEDVAKAENAPGIFQMFVRMAYANPNVMIALMKKFVPDKSHTELTGLEPLKFEVEILDGNKDSKDK